MYIPSYYRLADDELIFNIIQQNSFGLLLSHLKATHLAFTAAKDHSGRIILTGHMAAVNPQVQDLGKEALAIFQGPHGYISPSLYTRFNSVPTWNYVAVHCYGVPEMLAAEEHFSVVEELIAQHEPSYLPRWGALPDQYRNGLSKGIVAFRMIVEKVEAKVKLSQDRTAEECRNIIKHLKASEHSNDHDLAAWMEIVLEEKLKADS